MRSKNRGKTLAVVAVALLAAVAFVAVAQAQYQTPEPRQTTPPGPPQPPGPPFTPPGPPTVTPPERPVVPPMPQDEQRPRLDVEQALRPQTAQQAIQQWPEESRSVANEMIRKYGQPDGVMASRLIWEDADQWVEVVVYRDGVDHKFPMQHSDLLEQTIAYDVPLEKVQELAEYTGSLIIDRTKGTLTARCDSEAANYATLNLAHDIVSGEKSVDEARQEHARLIHQHHKGETSEYTTGFQFEVEDAVATGDPGEAVA